MFDLNVTFGGLGAQTNSLFEWKWLKQRSNYAFKSVVNDLNHVIFSHSFWWLLSKQIFMHKWQPIEWFATWIRTLKTKIIQHLLTLNEFMWFFFGWSDCFYGFRETICISRTIDSIWALHHANSLWDQCKMSGGSWIMTGNCWLIVCQLHKFKWVQMHKFWARAHQRKKKNLNYDYVFLTSYKNNNVFFFFSCMI